MKRKNLISLITICLVCAIFLGACSGAQSSPEQSELNGTTQTVPPTTEATQPPFTLDSIRTATLSDVPAYSLYYDTACYMLYYGLMDAEEDRFRPYVCMVVNVVLNIVLVQIIGISGIILINIFYLRIFFAHHLCSSIAGTIIDHNDLAVRIALIQKRIQRKLQIIFAVIG
jgi:hypothetical protein